MIKVVSLYSRKFLGIHIKAMRLRKHRNSNLNIARSAKMVSVKTKAMRLPEIFDFRQFPIAESRKFSTVETGPKENRGFERPKVSQNLPKIFPKMLTKNTIRK